MSDIKAVLNERLKELRLSLERIPPYEQQWYAAHTRKSELHHLARKMGLEECLCAVCDTIFIGDRTENICSGICADVYLEKHPPKHKALKEMCLRAAVSDLPGMKIEEDDCPGVKCGEQDG